MRLSAIRHGVLMAAVVLASTGVAGAGDGQAPATPAGQAGRAGRSPQAEQLRAQISMMERLLERAVGEGIVATRARMPELFSMPLISIEGNNRARGFRVDGYGVFFDVEVPDLPKSMAWSFRVMSRNNDEVIVRELDDLRALLSRAVTDEKDRAEAQRRILILQSRVSGMPPGSAPARSQSGTRRVQAPGVAGTVGEPQPLDADLSDPDAVYVSEVKTALFKAILDHGVAIPIGPNESLTVAASPSTMHRTGPLGDADSSTLYLTIRGQDLTALRSGQISREEARKRIRESEF